MAKPEDVSTDWTRSAGDFSCTVCQRKRLPATEFSKHQVEKALAALKTMPDKDIRTGPDIQHVHFLAGVCKKCMEEREVKEQEQAEAKRAERAEAAETAEIGVPERVTVSLKERPFGMVPSKAEGTVGYLVTKATEGKPAEKAGVKQGFRLVEVAGKPCGDLDLEAAQALLKGAELPVEAVFEAVPSGAEFCTACHQVLAKPLFSRKMLTKAPDKRRCSSCVEVSEAQDTEARAEKAEAEAAEAAASGKPQSKLSEFQQLCADSAKEAQAVTGLRAVKGTGKGGRGGKGRGK